MKQDNSIRLDILEEACRKFEQWVHQELKRLENGKK